MIPPAVALLVFASLVVGLLTVLIWRWGWAAAGTERPVLPAHYASLLQHDPGNYPGHCPDCGTDNDPGYQFCQECARELPSTGVPRDDVDISRIVED